MRLIIPMAGIGKRMRPHTLTTPKPLLPVAGKPIVQQLVESISSMGKERIEEIAFVTGRFGSAVENSLLQIAKSVNSRGVICYQDEALGTAHAVLCAAESLKGEVVVAFADTLFFADFRIDQGQDAVIWVNKVEDPSQFGVVKVKESGMITDFVEKSPEFVSDLAIVGIYYFRDGANLRKEIESLIKEKRLDKGEYQLTSVLEIMKNKGLKMFAGNVDEWLDCGNKSATVHTNKRILERTGGMISSDLKSDGSVVIQPCFIGKNVKLSRSVIGPHVSVGDGCQIENSVIENSILTGECRISNAVIADSMIGKSTSYNGNTTDLSLGDFNQVK